MTQGRRLDQYELSDVLGQGDILTIYRAHDTERDRPVILKLVQSHLQDDADLVAKGRKDLGHSWQADAEFGIEGQDLERQTRDAYRSSNAPSSHTGASQHTYAGDDSPGRL